MVTFFGGETLMNFPVLKKTVAYARARAAEVGKAIDFSLTTNATLLKPDVIEFLADERIGVTISIDGPQEIQDKFRVFNNGMGSYDLVAPQDQGAAGAPQVPADRRASHADAQTPGRGEDLPAPARRDGILGSRVRAGHHGAAARARDQRQRVRPPAEPVPRARRRTSCRPRSRTGTTASRTSARRCRRFTRGTRRPIPAEPASACWASPPTANVSLCHRFAGSDAHSFGSVTEGVDRGEADGVPRRAPHQPQDRLPDVLGAAHLRRRLLPRGPHPLRVDDGPQPALL